MSSPTPFDSVFVALEGVLKIPVMVGTVADSATSVERRIVFVRSGDPKYESIGYRVAGEKTIGRLGHPWKATIHGYSDAEVSERMRELIGAIDDLLGPPQGCAVEGHDGYAVTPGAIYSGDDAANATWAAELGITLYTRVRSEVRPTAQITKTTITATAQATADTSEASLEGSAGT